jgi:hypothetical protein
VKRNAAFLIITTYVVSFSLLFITPVFAEENWKVFEANCCSIKYQDDEHLRNFTFRIGGFKFTSDGLDDNPANVKIKVDEVMGKVQSILDMHPSDLHISILLYPDHNTLDHIFRQLSSTGSTPIAFYSHKTKTIYVDISSVTSGVLGHEIAHAVINFYFVTPPPAKMQEILAQYVDLHLWD